MVSSHEGCTSSQGQVVVELLRRVPPLSSEEPVDILLFFVRLQEIHNLRLVTDNMFIIHVLPLVRDSVSVFWGECINKGKYWSECKTQLFSAYFPYFV